MKINKFTYSSLKNQLMIALEQGYTFIRCEDYISWKTRNEKGQVIVLRVDIDLSVKRTEKLLEIFNTLGIKASFFVRLHAPEYNPFSFENYRILKEIVATGHEIGYHSEIVDQSIIWEEEAGSCLKRDIDVLNRMLGINIKGVASHGGTTGLNNLDFWKNRKASDFGLEYEGYDKDEYNLFQESFYISDSEWIRWKCYDMGVLRPNDNRDLSEHLEDDHKIIHLLIHPDTYYEKHIYEKEL